MNKINVAGTALLAVLLLVGISAVSRADAVDLYAYDGHFPMLTPASGSSDIAGTNLADKYAWDGLQGKEFSMPTACNESMAVTVDDLYAWDGKGSGPMVFWVCVSEESGASSRTEPGSIHHAAGL